MNTTRQNQVQNTTAARIMQWIMKVRRECFDMSEIAGVDYWSLVEDKYDTLRLLALATEELSAVLSAYQSEDKSYPNFRGRMAYKVALACTRFQMFVEKNYPSCWYDSFDSFVIEKDCNSHHDDSGQAMVFIALANRDVCEAIRYSITAGKQSNEVKASLNSAVQYIFRWWQITFDVT